MYQIAEHLISKLHIVTVTITAMLLVWGVIAQYITHDVTNRGCRNPIAIMGANVLLACALLAVSAYGVAQVDVLLVIDIFYGTYLSFITLAYYKRRAS